MSRSPCHNSRGRPSNYIDPDERRRAVQARNRENQRQHRERKRAEKIRHLQSSIHNSPSDNLSGEASASEYSPQPERTVVLFSQSQGPSDVNLSDSDNSTVPSTPDFNDGSVENSPSAAHLLAHYHRPPTPPSPVGIEVRIPLPRVPSPIFAPRIPFPLRIPGLSRPTVIARRLTYGETEGANDISDQPDIDMLDVDQPELDNGQPRNLRLHQPFHPSNSRSPSVEFRVASDHNTVAPYHRRHASPLGFDRMEMQDAIRTTAQFLVDNMINFQGCPAEVHSDARKQLNQHYAIDDPIGPAVVQLSDLMDAFERRVPEPTTLLPTGKWIDPTNPDIPTAGEFESLSCGTFPEFQQGDSPELPVRLSLASSEQYCLLPENLSLSVAYDIDSILAFPTSLGVAVSGLRIILHPSFIRNIQSDLHVEMKIPAVGRSRQRTARICDVPHFHLGQLCGPLNIDVFVFLPGLYDKDRGCNFPTQNHLQQFFDRIFLPSIEANTSSTYLQHIPASYTDAKAKALALGSEMRSNTNSSQYRSRVQLLHYHLPAELLHGIWEEVLLRTELPGNQHFRNVRLFLNAKNMKMETKRPQPLSCFTNFLQRWSQSCDGRYLQPQDTWIDYGKEIVYPISRLAPPNTPAENLSDRPHVHLWRKCCLQRLVQHAREKAQLERGGFKAVYYQWAQTEEAAGLTLTPNKSNILFQGGLVYSQFYSSTKEVFDAAKTYPFANPALEALAVDPHLTKAIQTAGGGRRIDLGRVRQAYLASRDRTLDAIRTNVGKSYGVREEHRVTLDLLKSIAIMLEAPDMRMKAAMSMTPRITNPFFCLPTADVFGFLEYNCLRYIIPFEVIARSTTPKDVPWEATKVMVMLLRCLRSAVGGGLLRDQSGIWKSDWADRATGKRRIGMGLGETLEQYGIGWLLLGRIDWTRLVFDPALSESMLFNDHALLKSYKARWGRVRTVQGAFLEVDQLACLLTQCAGAGAARGMNVILNHFDVLCIRAYRQEVWLALKDAMIFGDQEDEVRCLDGDIALTHHAFLSRRDPEKFIWYFPQPYNRRKFTPADIVARTWFFNQDKEAVVWEKPFRQLFQHCHRTISRAASKAVADNWKKAFVCAFLKYNRTFPHPNKHSFLARATKRDDSPLSFHTAVHTELEAGVDAEDVRWWNPSVWCVGSEVRYMREDAPMLRSNTVADVIRKAERSLARGNRRE